MCEAIDKKSKAPKHLLSCPICKKKNIISTKTCTYCNCVLLKELHMEEAPNNNNFINVILGKDIEHKTFYQDDKICIFDDKYPAAQYHLLAVPIEPIIDITCLNRDHLPLLKYLYEKSIETIKSMLISDNIIYKNEDIKAGFNIPVSVDHLHLHIILEPIKIQGGFVPPRFHLFDKVYNDIITHGHVIIQN